MKYALVGDSHTQIIFPNLIPLIENDGHEVVYTNPKAGWTLRKHIENNLENELINSQPNIVIYSLGGNNRDLDNKSYRETIKEGLKIARNSGAKQVIWISPFYALDDDVEKRHYWTHNFLRNVLPVYGVKYIDLRKVSRTGHKSDNVHFKNEKYKEMANLIHNKLPKFVIIPSKLKPFMPIVYFGIGFFIFSKLIGDKK